MSFESDLTARKVSLFLPPPMPGIPNCARTEEEEREMMMKKTESRRKNGKREEIADFDDDDGVKDIFCNISL